MEYVLKKIERMCKERGWTINHLTSLTELSGNTIYKWTSNKVKSFPKIDALQAVCDVFGITLATLFAKDEQEERTVQDIEILTLYNGLTEEEKENVKKTMLLLSKHKSFSESEL